MGDERVERTAPATSKVAATSAIRQRLPRRHASDISSAHALGAPTIPNIPTTSDRVVRNPMARQDRQGAVPQRVVQRAAPIQRRPFGKGEAAVWLATQVASLAPVPDELTYEQMGAWIDADADLAGDREANIGALWAVVDDVLTAAQRTAGLAGLAKRRDVTAKQREHVLRGEINGSKITGGHWRKGCVDNGLTVTQTKDHGGGFYTAWLSGDGLTKKESTFYPDSWTEIDVIDAIEYAHRSVPTNPYLDIMTPKGKGVSLFLNGDSYFPRFG